MSKKEYKKLILQAWRNAGIVKLLRRLYEKK